MGRLFLQHLGGDRVFACAKCDTFLTNADLLLSTTFHGASGQAYLFQNVVNIKFGAFNEQMMTTGKHVVQDVKCMKCQSKLGWRYEYAFEDKQMYKEGKVILERALITETDGDIATTNNRATARRTATARRYARIATMFQNTRLGHRHRLIQTRPDESEETQNDTIENGAADVVVSSRAEDEPAGPEAREVAEEADPDVLPNISAHLESARRQQHLRRLVVMQVRRERHIRDIHERLQQLD